MEVKMSLYNAFIHLQSRIYFDFCAFILFGGLFISYKLRKSEANISSLILLVELLLGIVASGLSFLCNITDLIFPHIRIMKYFVFILKYSALFSILLLFQCNSFYMISSTGIEFIVRRHKFLTVVNYICFLLPITVLLFNLNFNKLFYIDENLNIINTKYQFFFYIFIFIILLKDVVVLLKCKRYLSVKQLILLIMPYIVNCFFMLNLSFNTSIQQILFIFAITTFIQVSYAQRPELMVNPLFDAKSPVAFLSECRRTIAMTAKASVCFFKITNYKNLKLFIGQESYTDLIKKISGLINHILFIYKTYGSLYYLNHGVFAILIPGSASFKKQRFYTEINTILQQELTVKDIKLLCDCHMCVVEIPDDIKSVDYIREFAKRFDHIIPNTGNIVYISEISNKRDFLIKNSLKEIVERAIKENYFQVYYQPIYSVVEKKYVAAEALVRIQDPNYGLILPKFFINFAEQYGYMKYIGDFVFEQICKFISTDEYKASGLKFIAMNLSSSQCLEFNFVSSLLNVMRKYHVTTDEIKFEITEQTTLTHSDSIERKLYELYNMGIHFALDGYGTGYANIEKFITLPFDVVKLDRTFIAKATNPQIKVVIEHTINMFKKLGKKVLLEGIENEILQNLFSDQNYDFVEGCEYMQGYYYSEPMTQQNLLDFIKHKNKQSAEIIQ